MSETPPGWYPDPFNPQQVRYWDGVNWTEHAVPIGAPSGVSAKPSGASPLKITAIVLGVLFGFLLLLGVLAAIAVPTFRTVRENTAVRGATLQAEAIAGAASEWAASRGEVTGPMHVEEAIRAMGGDVDSSDGDRYSVYVEEVRVTCTFAYVPGPAAVVEACTAER